MDALAETLVRAYLKQIVVDGVFHADRHPGNVLVTATGQPALVDLGMVGRVTPDMQTRLLKLLLLVSEGRGEEAADIAVALGERLPDFNGPAFKREIATLVGRYGHETMADFQIGLVLLELTRVSLAQGMRPAAELTLLGKTLLNLDETARALSPGLDVNDAIRRNGGSMIMRVETPVRIFGYPALAMLMLLLAGAGAAYLAIQIVRHDRTPKPR